jgi:hypothetical protein
VLVLFKEKMPNIDFIPDVFYDGEFPYNVYFDNLPLKNIVIRQGIINAAVDSQNAKLLEAQGTAGSLAARLDESLDSDGTLSVAAIDDALHNIGAHTDGTYDSVDYVRMKLEERTKLENINDDATSFALEINSTVLDNTTVHFLDSDTITGELIGPSSIKLHTAFSTDSLRIRFYDVEPSTSDYINYDATGISDPYVSGSLRVYVNGIRLSSSANVLVYPGSDGPTGTWTALSYTEDADNGLFVLSRAITGDDIIRIDFDQNI